MNKTGLLILPLFLFSAATSAESTKQEPSPCETLHIAFTECFVTATRPMPINDPADPAFCQYEASFINNQVLLQKERDAIVKAMPLLSKELDDHIKQTGDKRNAALVKKYGKALYDFQFYCGLVCEDGKKGGEFIPYTEFQYKCPENTRQRKQ